MLKIRLLGQFDVRAGGQRVTVPTRTGQSLLAYLILNAGTPQRRERLAGMFWPDTSDEQARHNLRTELWRVRKALDGQNLAAADYLVAEELTVMFNPHAEYWLDAAQFAQMQCAEVELDDLLGQLLLYQGELLPGFYDDWVVLERERLQAIFENKMKHLLDWLCREGRWSIVAEWSERWIALGQTPEPAYRALMAAYAALGDRARAVATFERCQAALAQELNVEPSAETRELCEQLLRQESLVRVDLATMQIVPAQRLSATEPPAPGDPPFKGLQYFDEADADLFFGREAQTAQLVDRVRELVTPNGVTAGQRSLVVIIGASGSGKSSIVRAGLLPALKGGQPLPDGTVPPDGSARWLVNVITPTAHPLEALAVALTQDSSSVTAALTLLDDLARDPRSLALFSRRLLQRRHAPRLLLVIDQFEELFTLCRDEFEREAFIDNLLSALTTTPSAASPNLGEGGMTLILTLRADFYAHLAQYPELRKAVAQQQEYIGPMTADELRRAIEEPAKRRGWEFEPGLVDLMLRDAGAGDEPGALPLLSHALLETWQRRSSHTMTLKGYADTGGVHSAIACTAESIYQQMSDDQQNLARHLFLELTELGEGTEDTRRRVKIDELIEQSDQVRPLLTTLADARLITTGEDTIEVAHEALIREWPRLREWLNEDREGLRLQRHLGEAAHEWELLERDPGALYRGVRLSQANEWAANNSERLSASQRAFLAASNELEQHEAAEREAQRQRELQAALTLAETQQRSATRLRRRNRVIIGAGLIALLLAVLAGVFGAQANNNAQQAETNRSVAEANAATAQAASALADQQRAAALDAQATAEAERLRAKDQARLAQARELAAAAINNLDNDPELSILLALQSLSEMQSLDGLALPETQSALHRALQASRVEIALPQRNGLRAVLSPDGKHAATVNYNTAEVWDLQTQEKILDLAHEDAVVNLAYNSDGSRLATIGYYGRVRIFNALTGDQLLSFSEHGIPLQIAFTPGGKEIVVSTDHGTHLRDGSTGNLQRSITTSDHLNTMYLTSDGTQLATANYDGTATIWDVPTATPLLTVTEAHSPIWIHSNSSNGPFSTSLAGITDVAISPDKRYLATTSTDGTVSLWDTATSQILWTVPAHPGGVLAVAYSPNGNLIGTAGLHTVSLWDAGTGEHVLNLNGHTDWVNDLAFNAAGTQLITASGDKTARIWNIYPEGRPELFSIAGHAMAYSPDGAHLVVAQSNGTVILYDTVTDQIESSFQPPDYTGKINSLAFSPDAGYLAAGAENGAIYLWESSGKYLRKLANTHPTASALPVSRLVFSPDSRRLASANGGTALQVWDLATGSVVDELGGTIGASSVVYMIIYSVDYSQADDALLAVAGNNGTELRQASTGLLLPLKMAHPPTVHDIAFSPDGQRLASAGEDGVVKIWNTSKPDSPKVKILLSLIGHTATINRVVYSPDGTKIATASADRTVRMWDATTGVELLNLPGSAAFVDLAFSPDGRYLATAQADGTARIYLLSIDELTALARTRVTRSLTAEECQKYLHIEKCPAEP